MSSYPVLYRIMWSVNFCTLKIDVIISSIFSQNYLQVEGAERRTISPMNTSMANEIWEPYCKGGKRTEKVFQW